MKAREILTLFVAMFAAGTAVASLMTADQEIWIKARLSPAAEPECLNSQVTCDDQGSETCIIQVASVQTGPATTENTFTENCATNMVRNNTSSPEQSPLQVYELVQ